METSHRDVALRRCVETCVSSGAGETRVTETLTGTRRPLVARQKAADVGGAVAMVTAAAAAATDALRLSGFLQVAQHALATATGRRVHLKHLQHARRTNVLTRDPRISAYNMRIYFKHLFQRPTMQGLSND